MKEQLIKKYEFYLGNLKWHLQTNNPVGDERDKVISKIWIYEEILNDLKDL